MENLKGTKGQPLVSQDLDRYVGIRGVIVIWEGEVWGGNVTFLHLYTWGLRMDLTREGCDKVILRSSAFLGEDTDGAHGIHGVMDGHVKRDRGDPLSRFVFHARIFGLLGLASW